MPYGITAMRHHEVETLWRHTFPEYDRLASPTEWTQALMLPEDWKVVGVSMVPATDLVIFLLHSEFIEVSFNGLTYLSVRYMEQANDGLVLLTIAQYPTRAPAFPVIQALTRKEEEPMTDTRNISSDDAAILATNTPNTETGNMDEDPIGRGASKAGKVDMFRGYQPKAPKASTHGGNIQPGTGGLSWTPGAKSCPEIGPGRS